MASPGTGCPARDSQRRLSAAEGDEQRRPNANGTGYEEVTRHVANPRREIHAPRRGEVLVMSTGRTEKEQLRVHIRWMIRRDMPEVLTTEQQSFEFAWSEEDFLRCLRQRNCIGMVAEQGEKVIGFMIYELHKSKLHIMNFAVHPHF